MLNIIVAVAILSIFPSAGVAQVAKIYPVDEAAHDPEFFAFRARLLAALQNRDTNFLYGIVAPDILNSFGGDGGPDEFKEHWKPEQPASELWSTLTEILALGGKFRKTDPAQGYGSKMFIAPYVFAVESDGYDPFEYGVTVGHGVRVREQASRTSAVLATLDFDVIRVTDWKHLPDADGRSWIAIQLRDGRRGYVAAEFIRSRITYRAIFVFREGRWLLKTLVAGD